MTAKNPSAKKPKRALSAKPLAIIAAGGTGGHMFPAEALARELIERGWEIVLATDARGAQYAKDFPAKMRLSLDAATFKKGDVFGMIGSSIKIARGFLTAKSAFDRLKPWAVIGFGGYPSVPALMAGIFRKDATLIHEQNAVLGRSNRSLASKVDCVASAFSILRLAPFDLEGQVRVVGNPVRPEIKDLFDQPYPPTSGTLNLLITGGSQGAKILSENVPKALASLPMSWRIRLKVEQQARLEQQDAAKKIYEEAEIDAEVAPFFTNMAERLGRAHLVIGRAGASTISELAVAGRPSILIPLKIAADDHQTFNAEVLKEAKASVVIREDDATVERLGEEIRTILEGEALLPFRAKAAKTVAKPDAAARLADLVQEVVFDKWGVKS